MSLDLSITGAAITALCSSAMSLVRDSASHGDSGSSAEKRAVYAAVVVATSSWSLCGLSASY